VNIDINQLKRGDKVWYITNAQLRADMQVDRNRDHDPDPLPATVMRINKLSVRIRIDVSSPYEMSVAPERVFRHE
jgi:hypothetical protein